MCTPGLVVGVQAAGALTGAYGSYSEGLASKHYYDYLSSKSNQEAGLIEKQGQLASTQAQNEGAYETELARKKALEQEGAQRAVAGANVGGGSVTTENIASDQFSKEKLDQMAIKYNADMASWNAENSAKLNAWNKRQEAAGYGAAGRSAFRAGKMGAFNSLLSGATQVANTAYLSKLYAPSKMGQSSFFNKGASMPVARGAY